MKPSRTEFMEWQQGGAGIQRLSELLLTQSAIVDGKGVPLPAGALAVDFKNVTFGYVADNTVLHNLTFHLEAGRVLGVLGRTGSGKTTLARLLLRLYDYQAGEICLGNVPPAMASLRELGQRVGIVTQDVRLFDAPGRENLTFLNRAIPIECVLS